MIRGYLIAVTVFCALLIGAGPECVSAALVPAPCAPDCSYYFQYGGNNLDSLNLIQWDVSGVVNMTHMFDQAASFNQDISWWNVSGVIDMSYMFANATLFNQPIGNWNVRRVTDMRFMLYGASSFNRSLSCWCVSSIAGGRNESFSTTLSIDKSPPWGQCPSCGRRSVAFRSPLFDVPVGSGLVPAPCAPNCSHYFQNGANNLDSTALTNWDTSGVTNMDSMFYNASLFDQPIGYWNVSQVTNMDSMFYGASSFNQPIGSWDVSRVQVMTAMFFFASSFNQPIGNWNTSNVLYMSHMFAFATAFNQPIGEWNVSAADSLSYTFYNASSFNQPLGNWDVSSATSMAYTFNLATNFNQNLSCWCVSSVRINVAFSTNSSLVQDNLPRWGQCPANCLIEDQQAPSNPPVAAPTTSPTFPPIEAPASPPISPPLTPPIPPPLTPPIPPPLSPPIEPPASPPVPLPPVATPLQPPTSPPLVCVRRMCDGLCGTVQDGCGGIIQCASCVPPPPPVTPLAPGTIVKIRYPVVPVFNCWEPANAANFFKVRFGYINFDKATQTRRGRTENVFEPPISSPIPSVFASGTYAMVLEAVVTNFRPSLVNWTLDSSVVWRFNTSNDLRCPTSQNANLVITTPHPLTDEQKFNMTRAIAEKVGIPLARLLVRFLSVAKKRELLYNVAITFYSSSNMSSDSQPESPSAPQSPNELDITASSAASILTSLGQEELSTALSDSVEGVSIQVQQPPTIEPPTTSIIAPIPPPEITVIPEAPLVGPPGAIVGRTPDAAVNPPVAIIAGSIVGAFVLIVIVVAAVKLRDRILSQIAINAWFNRKRRIRPQSKPDMIPDQQYRNGTMIQMNPVPDEYSTKSEDESSPSTMPLACVASLGPSGPDALYRCKSYESSVESI